MGEAESEEKDAKGANDEAGVSGYQPVRVKRADLIQKNKTMPFKVNKGGGEEPQRVMVTVPYKMPVRISKDDAGEVPVPLGANHICVFLKHCFSYLFPKFCCFVF